MICFWCLQIRLGSLGHHSGLVTNRACPLNRWSSGIIHAEFACGVIASGLAVLSRASDVKQAANSWYVGKSVKFAPRQNQLARFPRKSGLTGSKIKRCYNAASQRGFYVSSAFENRFGLASVPCNGSRHRGFWSRAGRLKLAGRSGTCGERNSPSASLSVSVGQGHDSGERAVCAREGIGPPRRSGFLWSSPRPARLLRPLP
jgi:hypothetical protein